VATQPLHGRIGQAIEERSLRVVADAGAALKIATDLAAYGTCRACNVLIGRRRQWMEQQAAVRLLVIHAVESHDMEVDVQTQRRPKTLHDGQAPGLQAAAHFALPCTPAEVRRDGANQRAEYGAGDLG
jgi:hypothetical protein